MYFDSSCEMYAVTVFWADDSDDETVEAHHTSWLSPRRTHCRWPQMNVNNAIKKWQNRMTLGQLTQSRKYWNTQVSLCKQYAQQQSELTLLNRLVFAPLRLTVVSSRTVCGSQKIGFVKQHDNWVTVVISWLPYFHIIVVGLFTWVGSNTDILHVNE